MDAIGGYQLLGRVSENRPVSVWKGRDPASAREVALKQVELTSKDTINQLRAQVRILSGISHPGIVEVFELVEDQQHAWLIEAWVDGVRLSDLIQVGGPLSARQAARVVSDALPGLAHAHHHGIVHGNVTPASVFVDRTGAAKLADFGVLDPVVPVTPCSDVQAMASVLASLVSDPPAEIDKVLLAAQAERYRDAGELQSALDEAADSCFGDGWRDAADLGGRVLALSAPAAVVNPLVAATGPVPSVPSVLPAPSPGAAQVRSVNVAARPVDPDADAREYLEPRSSRELHADAKAGRFIPIAAAIVVVVAIVILILSHRDQKPSNSAGLAFKGAYIVTATLLSPGVGADVGKPAGYVLTDTWTVLPNCAASNKCTAVVTPPSGSPFTLSLVDGNWTGERPMPAAACIGSAGTSVGVYSFVLSSAPGAKAGQKLVGTVSAVFGGCGSSSTGNSELVVTARG